MYGIEIHVIAAVAMGTIWTVGAISYALMHLGNKNSQKNDPWYVYVLMIPAFIVAIVIGLIGEACNLCFRKRRASLAQGAVPARLIIDDAMLAQIEEMMSSEDLTIDQALARLGWKRAGDEVVKDS